MVLEVVNCRIVRDHFHPKNVWIDHVGEFIYAKNCTHLEGALNCTTKVEYDTHVAAVYKAFEQFPEHVKYFKKYFDHPESIAKYSIMKIRGGMCCISSAAAEQCHSSNEIACPTKIMGILSGASALGNVEKV